MDRHKERAEHAELIGAIIAYNIATFAGKQLKDNVELAVSDFMPSQRGKEKPVNREAVAEGFRSFFAAAIAKHNAKEAAKQKADEPADGTENHGA